MIKIYFSALCFFLSSGRLISQIGIGTATPAQSSILEMTSVNKGFLMTRIPLTSNTDITTVANPSIGMLVLASQNAGSGENAIYEGRMYKFNGATWDEMVEEGEIASGSLYPELVAVGKKTANTTCTNATMGNFQLTTLTNIKTTIKADGSIMAHKKGYYIWSVSIKQFMLKSAYSPFLLPGMLNYGFRDGTATVRAWQTTVFTGSVYLQQGDLSEPFQWHLGGTCVAQDLIGAQLVTWQYIGE
ncbi:hypothetical protein [Chryseobacterium lathyri]|uniref:hypothetical protein n=1 Tax=Chryseobacterium lathyri TaxID=395933 RepID=UPI0027853942|nr:hypothetical protein [Chryseobacterium lathyri]MDQ0065649.1 hypothetical protein [Chryseobacterium lathyri]